MILRDKTMGDKLKTYPKILDSTSLEATTQKFNKSTLSF